MMFSTIVLAGGQSTRMGQDKASLSFLGQPLWQRQQALAQRLGSDDIHISHPQFGQPDRVPGFGPLSGLDTLLPQCRHAQILVLAVDMPHLQPASLRLLLQYAPATSVCFSDSVLPCVLWNDTALRDLIRERLHPQGQRSVYRLLQSLNAEFIPCPFPDQLINTNTPEQWQQALASAHLPEAI
ncbi:molybdenum cofactor guanylyltransferase [Thalassolituus marinus]|uniref:Molybdenum cofactor guanylyltransferase n=1 Tax=Thalassolituus marinus TaxID=671053 RepID=A0ABS7ZRI9_9GAMM|nr:molybdenum cofactor guanylyltransferase [Thalassolituus marinus]MCA6063752.1 molybdenum cofactor guanylyltransferase [Thalassolituus marinus]